MDKETKELAAEIRADEQAARVRDFGEADAATYGQRVREGSITLRDITPEERPADADLLKRLAEIEASWSNPPAQFKAIMQGLGSVEPPSISRDHDHER
jgi:hypothetical protein